MDKERQIRFLYPPLIFLSSIVLGIASDKPGTVANAILDFIKKEINSNIVIEILGATSIILLIGFLLGTITVLFLRLLFCWNRFNYEFYLKQTIYDKIGKQIGAGKIEKKDRMFAGVVFDHGHITENIHRWIIRRWNAFFIATSSTIALALSLLFGKILKLDFHPYWYKPVILFIVFFIIQAFTSWKDTMRMIAFMTRVKKQARAKESKDDDDADAE
jgi:small-conductance mechanosensitive channel